MSFFDVFGTFVDTLLAVLTRRVSIVSLLEPQVFTWLGLFGHRLLKGTQLFSTLPGTILLKRKLTKQRRQAHAQLKALRKTKHQDYTKGPDGSVTGGPDLQSSAIYPLAFCRAVYAEPQLQLSENASEYSCQVISYIYIFKDIKAGSCRFPVWESA